MIGATGRVGREIVRGALKRGEGVGALVRDPGKARAILGQPDGLHIRSTQLLERLTHGGITAGEAELLIAREWSILAGENDYTTSTFDEIAGRAPRSVAEFLRDYRDELV